MRPDCLPRPIRHSVGQLWQPALGKSHAQLLLLASPARYGTRTACIFPQLPARVLETARVF